MLTDDMPVKLGMLLSLPELLKKIQNILNYFIFCGSIGEIGKL